MSLIKRPGAALSTRPLHFFFLADCSGSMGGEKIESLNQAIREALPHMKQVANENPFANVLIRAIKFSDKATWHIQNPTPVEQFEWKNLTAGGLTDLGAGLDLLATELTISTMGDRALPPVIVLLSDGQPTDDFQTALENLFALPWGKKAVRLAVAIGKDAATEPLQQFIANPEIPVLQANNPEALINHIRWASTVVLQSASAPRTLLLTDGKPQTNIPIPNPPNVSSVDVW